MTPTMEPKQTDAPEDLRKYLLREAFYLLLKMDEKQISEVLQQVRK